MSIISVSKLNAYLNNYESGTDITAVKQNCIDAAEAIVESYVGYNPISHTIDAEYHKTTGHPYLYQDVCHITVITEVLQNGEDITDSCSIRKDAIFSSKFKKNGEIRIKYTAGWESTALPPIFENTILRIASLMFAETNGSIGLTSRTSPDGSKTYISYSNYSKYLSPLDNFRRIQL